MKKVDTNNGVWVNDDPATLTNGTPIDADVMNNIQDEISNVITDNGGTLDGTNHSQLSQTLNKNFAKLNSPTLTGIPLTSNPDGTVDNQIATVDYVNQKALQATVGFTPTQQGGGTDQGANKIYIGGDSTDATQVRVQVDQTDLGRLVFQDNDAYTHGVDQIGFNIGGQTFAFRDASDKSWRFLYTTSQIDEKSYISSLPDGNNLKVSDIIWNSSSSLPALYYGTNNSVAYLATETWANTAFVKNQGNQQGGVIALDQNYDGSGYLSYQRADGSWGACQPLGDYATNTALTAETTRATTAESNLQSSKQDNLGFTPVQQGGGVNQSSNTVKIGWGNGVYAGHLAATVDTTDIGMIAMTSDLPTAGTFDAAVIDGSVNFIGGSWRKTGNVLEQWLTYKIVNMNLGNAGLHKYTYPMAFSDVPITIFISSGAHDSGAAQTIAANIDYGRFNPAPSATQFSTMLAWISGAAESFNVECTFNVYVKGNV